MNKKRSQFVIEYCIDFNATQAAIRAGYSVNRARQTGYDLLHNVTIKAEIAKRIAELCMGKDEILIRLGEQARGETPTKVTYNEYDEVKKEYATHQALQSLGKVFALFQERHIVEIDGIKFVDE